MAADAFAFNSHRHAQLLDRRWSDLMPSRAQSIELSARFEGLPGFALLGEVAQHFDFGPHLPKATFPPDFVAHYAALAKQDPVDWDAERTYFVARFEGQSVVAMYTGFFSPASIQSQNAILGAPSSHMLPAGHYAIGEAFEETSECRILICLDATSAHDGHLFLWRMQRNAASSATLAHLCPSLPSFWELLMPQPQAHAAILGSASHLVASAKLMAALEYADKQFSRYKKSSDLRAALPSLFRAIALNEPSIHADLPQALAALGAAPWQSAWPSDEAFAVQHFGLCLFESCIDCTGLTPHKKAAHIKTALPLPSYLALLLNAGFNVGMLIERWREMLAFQQRGALIHAAALRLSVQHDATGAFLDLPGLQRDQRDASIQLANFLAHDTPFAIQQASKQARSADERKLIKASLALEL